MAYSKPPSDICLIIQDGKGIRMKKNDGVIFLHPNLIGLAFLAVF